MIDHVVHANLSGAENGREDTGLSAIISPDGLDPARTGKGPAILMADINPEQITDPG